MPKGVYKHYPHQGLQRGHHIPPWNKGIRGSMPSGKNHYKWNGGVGRTERRAEMQLFKYKEWRLNIFTRDNFTCQICGAHGVYLEADHIKPWCLYPALRYELSNGRTLCRPCHLKTPTRKARVKRGAL